MKYEKERKFVKEVAEKCKREVTVSRIRILETSSKDGNLISVIFKDRFGIDYLAFKKDGISKFEMI